MLEIYIVSIGMYGTCTNKHISNSVQRVGLCLAQRDTQMYIPVEDEIQRRDYIYKSYYRPVVGA